MRKIEPYPCCDHCHHYEPEQHYTPCASCDNDRAAEAIGLREPSTELTVRQAERLLIEWAAVSAGRDGRVRTAYASGVSKMRIHELSGLARSTVDQILAGRTAGPHGPTGAAVTLTPRDISFLHRLEKK